MLLDVSLRRGKTRGRDKTPDCRRALRGIRLRRGPGGFQPIAQGIGIAAFQAALAALAFACFDQVSQAARALYGRFAAFSAAMFSLHTELVLALPGNRQVRKLILNSFSHGLPVVPVPGQPVRAAFPALAWSGRLTRITLTIPRLRNRGNVGFPAIVPGFEPRRGWAK